MSRVRIRGVAEETKVGKVNGKAKRITKIPVYDDASAMGNIDKYGPKSSIGKNSVKQRTITTADEIEFCEEVKGNGIDYGIEMEFIHDDKVVAVAGFGPSGKEVRMITGPGPEDVDQDGDRLTLEVMKS